MVMGNWFSGPAFGGIMGTQWTAVVLVAATGPVLVGALRDATGGYQTSFALLAGSYLVAAAVILASSRVEPGHAGADEPGP